MALSVQSVKPVAGATLTAVEFWKLQGGSGGPGEGLWRPHITVGTRSEDIRPFEANRVMHEAEKHAAGGDGGSSSGGSQLHLLELTRGGQARTRVRGRLMGLYS